MTSALTLPTETDLQSQYETAVEALAAAKRMRPVLEGFIRVVSRNPKMRLLFDGGGSRTDGKTVWLTPPGDLGKYRSHDKHECSVRDEYGLPVCNACRVEESFFHVAVHECAHQVHHSTVSWDQVHVNGLEHSFIERKYRHHLGRFDRPEHDDEVMAREWAEGDWREFLRRAEREPEMGYMGIASHISPWLPNLLNAFEDARVNAKTFDYRPGVTRMFVANTKKLISEGYVSITGEVIHWGDQPLNAQITISGLLRASNYDFDYSPFLDDEAVNVWDDDTLSDLVDSVKYKDSIQEVFDTALAALRRLQELGHLLDSEEPAGDDDGDGGEPDDGSGESSDSGGSGSGTGESDDCSGDEASDESGDGSSEGDESGEGTDAGGPGEAAGTESAGEEAARRDAREGQAVLTVFTGHAADLDEVLESRDEGASSADVDAFKPEADDQAEWSEPDQQIEVATVHAEHFDESARGIGRVNVFKFSDPARWEDTYCRYVQANYERDAPPSSSNVDDLDEVAKIAAQSLPRIRKIFTVNKAVRTTRNMKVGRVDSGSVGRKLKTGRDDVFKRREIPNVRSYKVVIGLDVSGSTSNSSPGTYSKVILSAMKAAAYAQAEMLNRVGIPFAFYAHTGGFGWDSSSPSDDGRPALNLIEVKDWKDKWGPETKKRLACVEPCASNLDGHTMEFYRKQLESRPEDLGLMLYYTDGAMPAENYHEELEVLQREVKNIKRRNDIDVLAIGVGNTEPEQYGLDTVYYGGTQHLPDVVKALEAKITGLR